MVSDRLRGVGFAVTVQLIRMGVIVGCAWLAPTLGIRGWWVGLFVNAVCCLYAAALMTWLKLWRSTGFLTLWRGRAALLLLFIPFTEALAWIIPTGITDRAPGWPWWALSLLMVGFNEELISRGVVLHRLGRSWPAAAAVTFTGLLFGLQHLSLFATTSRDAYDILTNVLASAAYGFALAAFQYRFAWILPLILVHGLSDFTTVLRSNNFGDLVIAGICLLYLAYGIVLLRTRQPHPIPTRNGATWNGRKGPPRLPPASRASQDLHGSPAGTIE
jgi:membrane protease YdiL (CAAX protease family)